MFQIYLIRSAETCRSVALEVSDDATGDAHDVRWRSTEVVVPCPRCRPHLVVLQQVRINEHTKLCAVTKGRHAFVGLGNPSSVRLGNGPLNFPHVFH